MPECPVLKHSYINSRQAAWRKLWSGLFAVSVAASGVASGTPRLELLSERIEGNIIEVRGVQARSFDSVQWWGGHLNFVPDERFPLLTPLSGASQNIYAPSCVQIREGYEVFFGGWDGSEARHDHVYAIRADTEFLHFSGRQVVIAPGSYEHVCNVNAISAADGGFDLLATVYPVAGLNRPAFFHVSQNHIKAGKAAPLRIVSEKDLITLSGYNLQNADINGMNCVLKTAGRYELYFGDFRNQGVFHGVSTNGHDYVHDGKVLKTALLINDVKHLRAAGEEWTLLGFHQNGPNLFYSLSTNAVRFSRELSLFAHRTIEDQYIVSMGFVIASDKTGTQRVLGVLYGAGAAPSLDANRIFARWLQLKVVFVPDEGLRCYPFAARGPDIQRIPLPAATNSSTKGHFEILAEDGHTRLGISSSENVPAGSVFKLIP
jgi:hypothetical protein